MKDRVVGLPKDGRDVASREDLLRGDDPADNKQHGLKNERRDPPTPSPDMFSTARAVSSSAIAVGSASWKPLSEKLTPCWRRTSAGSPCAAISASAASCASQP